MQCPEGFEVINNRVSFSDQIPGRWKIGCIEIEKAKSESKYLFTFQYSHFCGKPVRYDKLYNPLAEKAFELSSNEYGRIMYNGRHTHLDTGEWYYELHLVNAMLIEDTSPNVWISKDPTKEYKQLEILF
ncbi:hypothetical protein D3C76_1397000 [compost metagenome]